MLREAGSSWKLDLDSYAMTVATNETADENHLPAGRIPHPSLNTAPETELTWSTAWTWT